MSESRLAVDAVLVRVAAGGYFSAQQAVYTTGDAPLTYAPAPLWYFWKFYSLASFFVVAS